MVVGIGVCAVAAAEDIASDAGVHTQGVTAIDTACDVIAAIDIIDVTALYKHTGGQTRGEKLIRILVQCDARQIRVWNIRMHVGHTAAAKDVINFEHLVLIRVDIEYQSILAGHGTLVAAGVDVSDESAPQIPPRADSHRGLVVAAEERAYLEVCTGGVSKAWIITHLLDAIIGEKLAIFASMRIVFVDDAVHHLAGVIHMDDGLPCHCGVVAAAEGIHDGTAHNLQISLAELGFGETVVGVFYSGC